MSNSTKKFLKDENIRVLDWMPKGCDLSPIEHVWPLIKQELWNYQFSEERGHLNPLT